MSSEASGLQPTSTPPWKGAIVKPGAAQGVCDAVRAAGTGASDQLALKGRNLGPAPCSALSGRGGEGSVHPGLDATSLGLRGAGPGLYDAAPPGPRRPS